VFIRVIPVREYMAGHMVYHRTVPGTDLKTHSILKPARVSGLNTITTMEDTGPLTEEI
jgi:hypothetical protein